MTWSFNAPILLFFILIIYLNDEKLSELWISVYNECCEVSTVHVFEKHEQLEIHVHRHLRVNTHMDKSISKVERRFPESEKFFNFFYFFFMEKCDEIRWSDLYFWHLDQVEAIFRPYFDRVHLEFKNKILVHGIHITI